MKPPRLLLVALLCPLLFAVLPHEAAAQIPTVRVFADACIITEGETATYTLTADPAPTADLQVDFKAFISGVGSVIAVPGDLGTKSVTISANQTTATYAVRTRNDSVIRKPDQIKLYVNDREDREPNPYRILGGQLGRWSAITHVLDKASPPLATFVCSFSIVPEDAGVQNVTVKLTSPAPSSGVVVNYSVDGESTATSGDDFVALSGSVQAPAGATSVDIPVSIIHDALDESQETVILTLTGASGYTLGPQEKYKMYIEDRDPPPLAVVRFAEGSSGAAEDAGVRNVRVNLSPAPSSGVAVKYSVGGTATSGDDFTALSGLVQVAAGATSVDIPVSIIDDALQERDETVILRLKPATGYAVGAPNVHRLTVEDNDTPEASFAGGGGRRARRRTRAYRM